MQLENRKYGSEVETLESITLMSASVIEGSDAGEWVNGDSNDNHIDAGGGNDEIYAPLGDNSINGGAGDDVLIVYGKTQDEYSIDAVGNGSYVVRGEGLNGQLIENTIENVEAILFDDGVVELDTSDNSTALDVPMFDALPEAEAELASEPAPVEAEAERPFGQAPQVQRLFVAEAQPVELPQLEEVQQTAPQPEPEPTPEPEPEPENVPELQSFNGFGADTGAAQQAVAANDDGDFISRVVELTNEVRRQNGLSDLTINAQLQSAAQQHTQNMAYQDFFSHTGQDGTQPWDRGVNAGYDYRNYGENIAAGQRTPEEVVQAWVDSPGHLANILNPAFTEIGVGYEYLQSDPGNLVYNSYWAQEFGRPR